MENRLSSKKFNADLQATCASLGYTDENGIYQREPDCLESVKDLIRFMKRDDDLCTIRRQLGSASILQTDLLPIVKQIGTFFMEKRDDSSSEKQGRWISGKSKKEEEERVLLETVIRLVVNLTQPARLCFGDKVPAGLAARQSFIEIESYLQKYKEAFIDKALFSALSHKLGTLLKLDWESRQEEDRLLIERILLLVRNILQVPPDVQHELRTDDDASIHDQILWSLHVSGFNDLLLYLSNSGEERHLVLHVAEILSLMLREQTPDQLATCGVARAKSEIEKDKKELEEMLDRECRNRRTSIFRSGARHSVFGGTYRLENMKSISDRDIIVHRTPILKMDALSTGSPGENPKDCGTSTQNKDLVGRFSIDLSKGKNMRRKPKNRLPVVDADPARRSSYAVRSMLKEFCVQFLDGCYNPTMRAVKDALIRSRAQENDESYYFRLLTFMMQFNRKHNFRPALTSETLSTSTFHYVTTQLERYFEMTLTEKNDAVMWSKRMHLALRSYHELLEYLAKMDQSSDSQMKESSRVIKSNIFYTMEYRDVLLMLVKKFDNTKQSKLYLRDLLETNHLFMRLLEHFCRDNRNLVVQRNKKKIVKRKSKSQNKPHANESTTTSLSGEKLWEEISEEVSQMLQGLEEIPRDVMPFDAASDVDIDQQGIEAVRTIHDCLKRRKSGEAVALFRSAREVWPDRVEFRISSDAPEDEFLALREICLLNFPESEEAEENDGGDDDDDDDDEDKGGFESVEQSFSFREFVLRYSSPLVVRSCVAFLEDFKTSSSASNHCALKLLHRIGFDCGAIGILFQTSLFNIFRKFFSDQACATAKQFAELKTFAIHVVRKFVEVASSDKKVIVEMFFWKSVKEAMDLTSGEDKNTLPDPKQSKGWSEEQDEELKYLFEEIKDSEEQTTSDGKESDMVDRIMERMSDQSKTRRQVLRQMVLLGLISKASEVKKKSRTCHGWSGEELNQLREIIPQHLQSQNPMTEIMTSYNKCGGVKSRASVRKKIIELGLAEKTELKRKRRNVSKGKSKCNASASDEFEDAVGDDDGDEEEDNDIGENASSDYESEDRASCDEEIVSKGAPALDSHFIKKLKCEAEAKGLSMALSWLRTKLDIVAKDRDIDESLSMPLVPITEDQDNAMADQTFVSLLLACGLKKPSNEQEQFWRIPSDLTSTHLHEVVRLILEDDNLAIDPAIIEARQAGFNGRKKVTRAFGSDSEEGNPLIINSNIGAEESNDEDEKLIIDEANGYISDADNNDDSNVTKTSRKVGKRKQIDLSSDDESGSKPLKKTRRFFDSDDEEEIVYNKSHNIVDSDDDDA